MGSGEDGDERFRSKHLGAEIALVDRRSEEAEVERAVDELRHLGGRQQLASEVERYAGQFLVLHNIGIDSKGNLYTSEVGSGKRAQKFRPAN